jgi:hypothetical protein
MTAYSGLVLIAALIGHLDLRRRLRGCFAHLDANRIIPHGVVYLLLVVQQMLGLSRLRDVSSVAGDPLLKRLLGLTVIPSTSTVSRMLCGQDARSVDKVHQLNRDVVIDRLVMEKLKTVTMDLDGSVQSTTGHAEGSAVGFNKKKKGARSYYPLFSTIAQTSQVLDFLHRPGNVHDHNGAPAFARRCYHAIRSALPNATIESRFDSAFCSYELLEEVDRLGIAFSCSVPFARWPQLKAQILSCTSWSQVNATWSICESTWKPESWPRGFRVLWVRKRRKIQQKGPLQLDLFEPRDYEFEYKVIITNKTQSGGAVLHFHNGRGSQEKLLGEGKQGTGLGRVATKTQRGNELFTMAAVFAHNLGREIQMVADRPTRSTSFKRPAKWIFRSLQTLQKRLFHRPGRLVRPQGRLTLKIAAQSDEQELFKHYMSALREAA